VKGVSIGANNIIEPNIDSSVDIRFIKIIHTEHEYSKTDPGRYFNTTFHFNNNENIPNETQLFLYHPKTNTSYLFKLHNYTKLPKNYNNEPGNAHGKLEHSGKHKFQSGDILLYIDGANKIYTEKHIKYYLDYYNNSRNIIDGHIRYLYKLENSFINKCFYIKDVDTNKYITTIDNRSDHALFHHHYDPSYKLDYLFEFELIGETPKPLQNALRLWHSTNNVPLTEY
jgi:hypothetical protein